MTSRQKTITELRDEARAANQAPQRFKPLRRGDWVKDRSTGQTLRVLAKDDIGRGWWLCVVDAPGGRSWGRRGDIRLFRRASEARAIKARHGRKASAEA